MEREKKNFLIHWPIADQNGSLVQLHLASTFFCPLFSFCFASSSTIKLTFSLVVFIVICSVFFSLCGTQYKRSKLSFLSETMEWKHRMYLLFSSEQSHWIEQDADKRYKKVKKFSKCTLPFVIKTFCSLCMRSSSLSLSYSWSSYFFFVLFIIFFLCYSFLFFSFDSFTKTHTHIL